MGGVEEESAVRSKTRVHLYTWHALETWHRRQDVRRIAESHRCRCRCRCRYQW